MSVEQTRSVNMAQDIILNEIIRNEGILDANITILKDDFKGDNYMGELVRIVITGKNDEDEPVERNFLLKKAPTSSTVRDNVVVKQFYNREIFTYKTMLTALELLQTSFNISKDRAFTFVKFYGAVEKEPEEIIAMENMSCHGFVMCPRAKPLDLDHIKLIIKRLAQFHGLGFGLKKYQPDLYKEIADDIAKDGYSTNTKTFINNTMKNATNYITDPEYRKKFADFATYDVLFEYSQAETCAPFTTLCHGDFWQNNILFQYQDGKPTNLIFVDWQWVKHTSPVVDLTHIIFSATDQSFRKLHYAELLELYYQSLHQCLVSLGCNIDQYYPRNIYEDHLNTAISYSLVFATTSLTFAMRDNDDLTDLETSVQSLVETKEYNFKFKNESSTNEFIQRLNGIVSDYVEMGIL